MDEIKSDNLQTRPGKIIDLFQMLIVSGGKKEKKKTFVIDDGIPVYRSMALHFFNKYDLIDVDKISLINPKGQLFYIKRLRLKKNTALY